MPKGEGVEAGTMKQGPFVSPTLRDATTASLEAWELNLKAELRAVEEELTARWAALMDFEQRRGRYNQRAGPDSSGAFPRRHNTPGGLAAIEARYTQAQLEVARRLLRQ